MAITCGPGESDERITISGGVAAIAPGTTGGHDTAPDALLRAADQALYKAKCQGRNRIAMASAPTGPTVPQQPAEPSITELAS
jgi:PleD family two-component response regulator